LDADSVRRPLAAELAQQPTDLRMDLLGLRGSGVAPRPDRPDRLVGKGDPLQRRGVEAGERAAHLTRHDRPRLRCLAFLEALSHAHDRMQPFAERCAKLLGYQLVSFEEVLPPLAVT